MRVSRAAGRSGGKAPPVWQTASGSLGTCANANRASFTATQAVCWDGDTNSNSGLTYSVVSGSIPSGMSLNSSTGAITGTPSQVGSDTTYSFTLRATDLAGQILDRS